MDYKAKIKAIVEDEAKVDEIISSIKEAFIDKEQYNRKVGELKTLTAERESYLEQLEAAKVAQMSSEDKLKHELDKLESAKQEFARKTNLLDVKNMFVSKGINTDDYAEIIEGLVSHDAEVTKKVATGVLDMIVKQTENAVSKTKQDLIDGVPQPGATGQNAQQPLKKIREI